MALVITLIAVLYQRATGPTYPKTFDIGIKENTITVKLPRSQGGNLNAPIELAKMTNTMSATLSYKRFPTDDPWTVVKFSNLGNILKGSLPNQPPAGKIIYFVKINYGESIQELGTKKDPIYLRYKGEVPTYILAPHIFCMFFSLLLSMVALFEAAYNTQSYKLIARLTLACLMTGGMVLGPIVQKYAFGVYWAGFPYDYDLTDNKLLILVITWLLGVGLTIKSDRRWPIYIAAVAFFAVYSIPHSMQGSELDYKKGKVITNME